MENEYIHIIFDDHELHALLSLGTRYALGGGEGPGKDCTRMRQPTCKYPCSADLLSDQRY